MVDLSLLGLNSYESNIYTTLLEHPGSTAAQIAKHSQVPQNRVYDVVENLIAKKLVFLIPEKTKRYAPESPEQLHALVQAKEKELKSVKKKLDDLRTTYKSTKKQEVLVSRTAKNFEKIVRQIPQPKQFFYSIKPELSTAPYHIRSFKEYKQNGAQPKIFTDPKHMHTTALKKWKTLTKNIGFLETKGVIISVTEETVLISLLPPENESLIIYVENENFAAVLKQLFDSHYKVCEKVE